VRTIGSIFFAVKNPMLWMAVLICPLATSQQAVPLPAQSVIQQSSDARVLTFDVVSIRKNNGDDTPSGFYSDGYKAIGRPLWQTISYAFSPMLIHDKQLIKDAPSWVFDEKYDLIAKVAPGDVDAWQKLKMQTPTADNLELQAMFQKLLEDRCALKVHRAPTEIDGYDLVATKRLKLAPGKADTSSLPGTHTIIEADGGTVNLFHKEDSRGWEFHNVSMTTLLSFLAIFSSQPIQDKTNLKGKYDFTVEVSDEQSDSVPEQSNLNDFMSVQSSLQGFGLTLNHAKVWTNAVVIDHIERPTAN
jgi:uncharacterized protein (TIGR03435 family)